MRILLLPALVTLTAMLFNMFVFKEKISPWRYVLMFFGLMAFQFASSSIYSHASETAFLHGRFIQDEALTPAQRNEYIGKRQYH